VSSRRQNVPSTTRNIRRNRDGITQARAGND
jgi:hypothetical protein